MFEPIFKNVFESKPIVHCITNFVTVNDCANIILAGGGSPTMAHHKDEVEEITKKSQSLVLNMGNVHEVDSMILAGKRSNTLEHPVIIDPVGIGASKLRNETFFKLSQSIQFSVIRGNISEIKRIANEKGVINGNSMTKGVDADEIDKVTEDSLEETVEVTKRLSKVMQSVIVISGAIDIVAYKEKAYVIRNGHPIMAQITGTGCMSTALIGAFCGGNPNNIFEATLAAVATMGVSGDIAFEKMKRFEGGTMMFRMFLIDNISNMTLGIINKGMNIEEI
ncbi:hydroxyethylthiazole kinase [Clostridium lundense]|uniref:hydroxyethylthiazole kinase n=1 Tax=Clostridium lundense TaxID=319475 RepID=UPI000485D8CA|nr:hydroxyethylthiazole kinase [Clostridium lundense]